MISLDEEELVANGENYRRTEMEAPLDMWQPVSVAFVSAAFLFCIGMLILVD